MANKQIIIPINLSDTYFDKGVNTVNKIEYKLSYTIASLKTSISQPGIVMITDPGKEGLFKYDSTDTTSVNNDISIIVDVSNKRWKRVSDIANTNLPLTGGTIAGTLNVNSFLGVGGNIGITAGQYISSKDNGGTYRNMLGYDGGSNFYVGDVSNAVVGSQIVHSANAVQSFYTNGIERTRITQAGNIGIGNSNPLYKLDILGNARITDATNTGNLYLGDGTINKSPGSAFILGGGIVTDDIQTRSYSTNSYNVNGIGSITNGLKFTLASNLSTNTTSLASGVVPHNTNAVFNRPTFASTNLGVVNTLASNVYIDGAPIAGTNTTITNPFALYVNSGNSYFGGNVGIGNAIPVSRLSIQSTGAVANQVVMNLNNPYSYGTGLGQGYSTLRFNRSPNDAGSTGVMSDISGGNEIESSSTLGFLAFNTRNGATETTVERMRINSSGNVGIGTTNITQKLNVVGQGVFGSSSPSYDSGDGFGSATRIGYSTSGDYGYIIANNTGVAGKNLILQPTGFGSNVGIGTLAPNYKLDVTGAVRSDKLIIGNTVDNSNALQVTGNANVGGNTTIGGNILLSSSVSKIGFNNDAVNYYIGGISSGMEYKAYSVGNFTFTSGNGNWNFTNGNVGIGTTAPAFKLDVTGTLNATGYINTNTSLLLSSGTFALWDGTYQRIYNRAGQPAFSIGNTDTYYDVPNNHYFRKNDGTNIFTISANNNAISSFATRHLFGTQTDDGIFAQFSGAVHVKSNGYFDGNVGIGTTTPVSPFHVKLGTNQNIFFAQNQNGAEAGTAGIISINDVNNAYTPLGFYASKYNFGGGNLIVGSNTDNGNKLQVNGNASITGNLGINTGTFRFTNTLGGLGEFGRISAYNTIGTVGEASSVAFIRDAMTDGNYGAVTINTFGSERMRIGSNGFVGVGTTNPYSALQVNGYGQSQGITLGDRPDIANVVSTSIYTANVGSGILNIQTGKANVGGGITAIQPDGGSVGIGIRSPATTLDVFNQASGGIRVSGNSSRFTLSGGATNQWNIDNYGGVLRFFREDYSATGAGINGAVRMAILDNGNIGIGTTTPVVALDVVGGVNTNTAYYLGGTTFASNASNGTANVNARVIANSNGTGAYADGMYIGYLNSTSAPTRIYDGGNANYLGIGSATISTGGITKFLFGNQTDDGTAAQFASNVRVKGTLRASAEFAMDVNNKFIYMTDASGIGRRMMGLSTNNAFYAGDVDNTIVGSQTVFATNTNHLFYINGSEKARFIQNGNFGLSITAPRLKMEIAATTIVPTALSVVTADGNLLLSDGGNLGVVHGISNYNSSYQGYVQARNNTASSIAYNYLINPLGGNVGIGTTGALFNLHTVGTAKSDKLIIGTNVDNGNAFQVNGNATIGGSISMAGTGLAINTAGNAYASITYIDNQTSGNTWLSGPGVGVGSPSGFSLLYNSTTVGNIIYAKNDGKVGIGTTTPAATLDINGSTRLMGSVTGNVRIITGVGATYAITATDYVVILLASPGSTYTVDVASASNIGRQLHLVNKVGGNQTLSQNFVNLAGVSTNQLLANSSTKLIYDGTTLQQF